MLLKDGYNEFIKSRELQGLSVTTIVHYRETISRYLRYAGFDTPLEGFSMNNVEPYICQVINSRVAQTTKHSYILQMKIFLVWMERKDFISIHASEIPVPKAAKKVVQIYTADEIKLIHDSAVSSTEWITMRNKAILMLMLDSGARLNEICTLKRKNVRFDATVNLVKVNGKGNKERYIPFGKYTASLVQSYLKLCPYKSDNLFVSFYGNNITRNALRLMMSKIAKKLPFKLSAHWLRHNFATNYMLDQYNKKGSFDVYRLKLLMGHESIETTEVYMHAAEAVIAAKENISHVDLVFLPNKT